MTDGGLRRVASLTRTLAVEEGVRSAPVIIASTAGVDRYGDIIEQESIRFADFARNPVLLYGHEWGGAVIGNAITDSVKLYSITGAERPALGFSPEWDDHETNPTGRLVAHQWGKFLHAVSIGGYAHKMVARTSKDCPDWAKGEGGYFIQDFELLEISACPIPANPGVGQLRTASQAGASLASAVRAALLDPEFLAALRSATAHPSPRADDTVESLFR